MADEKKLTELSPMDRARRVAKDIYSRIPEAMAQYQDPMASQSPISKSYSPEVTQFAEDMLPGSMAEARDFVADPGVGTAAMAALGMFGIPAREMKGLAKLVGKKVDDMTDADLYEALKKYKPMTDARLGDLKKSAQDKLSTVFGSDFRSVSMLPAPGSGLSRSDFTSVPEYNAWRKQTDTELMLRDAQNKLEDKLGVTAQRQAAIAARNAERLKTYNAIKAGKPTPELGEVDRFNSPEKLQKRRDAFVRDFERSQEIDRKMDASRERYLRRQEKKGL